MHFVNRKSIRSSFAKGKNWSYNSDIFDNWPTYTELFIRLSGIRESVVSKRFSPYYLPDWIGPKITAYLESAIGKEDIENDGKKC